MIKIFLIILSLLFFQNISSANVPFDKKNIKFIYQLKDKKIYVVKTETLDLIYEFNENNKKYTVINKIYNFVGYAEKCKVDIIDKELTDVFLGQLKLIYLNAGTYESKLLLFKMTEKRLTFENSLGAFKSFSEFNKSCKLYKSINDKRI